MSLVKPVCNHEVFLGTLVAIQQHFRDCLQHFIPPQGKRPVVLSRWALGGSWWSHSSPLPMWHLRGREVGFAGRHPASTGCPSPKWGSSQSTMADLGVCLTRVSLFLETDVWDNCSLWFGALHMVNLYCWMRELKSWLTGHQYKKLFSGMLMTR